MCVASSPPTGLVPPSPLRLAPVHFDRVCALTVPRRHQCKLLISLVTFIREIDIILIQSRLGVGGVSVPASCIDSILVVTTWICDVLYGRMRIHFEWIEVICVIFEIIKDNSIRYARIIHLKHGRTIIQHFTNAKQLFKSKEIYSLATLTAINQCSLHRKLYIIAQQELPF